MSAIDQTSLANVRKNLQMRLDLSEKDITAYKSLAIVKAEDFKNPEMDLSTALMLPINAETAEKLRLEYKHRKSLGHKTYMEIIVATDRT